MAPPKKYLHPVKLRRLILDLLYAAFKEHPYAQMELKDIEQACGTDTKALNWNIVYLEKCGFVELGKSIDWPPFVACSAAITARGIDLIENELEFNRRFPIDDEDTP